MSLTISYKNFDTIEKCFIVNRNKFSGVMYDTFVFVFWVIMLVHVLSRKLRFFICVPVSRQ